MNVLDIAGKVRKACYKFAMSEDSKGYDFHADESLACMCAIGSYVLYQELKAAGYEPVLKEGKFNKYNSHCWIEVDNKIVDVTATQFRPQTILPPHYDFSADEVEPLEKVETFDFLPEVYVTELNSPYYSNGKVRKSTRSFRNWVSGQKPNRFVEKAIRKLIK